jgi:hypothetical protein
MIRKRYRSSTKEKFARHQAEIAERFDDKGLFGRVACVFSGLSKKKRSREYKRARIELKRLIALLLAILVPALVVTVAVVTTAISSQPEDIIEVEIARVEEEPEELIDEKEFETEMAEFEITPEEMVDVQIDTTSLNPGSVLPVPVPAPCSEPLNVKPVSCDSPVMMKLPADMRPMAGSRNPGVIGRMTSGGAECGDSETEAAVLKVLWWLKSTQDNDGGWMTEKKNASRIANAAFAVLTYLAHGETPASPDFGETVEKAMQFLIECQYVDKGGTVRFAYGDKNEYAFLIATYALCETYGMTRNPNARAAAIRGLRRIIDSQSATGGWDYKMNKASSRDDLSYGGWALQALKAGKMAGLRPEGLDECIKKGVRCLVARNFHKGGFTYTAKSRQYRGLTAAGCLALQLLGHGDSDEVRESLEYMKDWRPSFSADGMGNVKTKEAINPQYYCYYAAQCKYQAGMKRETTPADHAAWLKWNEAMKDFYPSSIKNMPEKAVGPDGKEHDQGYFENNDRWSTRPVMDSCLVALQLMVYYRYLPTMQTRAGEVELETPSVVPAIDEVAVDVDI